MMCNIFPGTFVPPGRSAHWPIGNPSAPKSGNGERKTEMFFRQVALADRRQRIYFSLRSNSIIRIPPHASTQSNYEPHNQPNQPTYPYGSKISAVVARTVITPLPRLGEHHCL